MKTLNITSKICLLLLFFIGFTQLSFGQMTDEEQIKKIAIAANSDDILTWESTQSHEPNTSRTELFANYLIRTIGFENQRNESIKWKNQTGNEKYESKYANFVIKQDGKLAFIEYDIFIANPTNPKDTLTLMWHKSRFLIKENNDWKVFYSIGYQPESFKITSEYNLNTMGYQFLEAKKVNNAIEVFKLNTKLFPTSWNVYDSLGDGYEAAGEHQLAIKSYQKSIEINPKNEESKKKLLALEHKKKR